MIWFLERVTFYIFRPGSLLRAIRFRVFGHSPNDVGFRNDIVGTSEQGLLADCAFRIGGGLGDHVIAARYISDLIATVGGLTFDVFSSRPGIADWLFQEIKGFQNCYDDHYSWEYSRGRYAVRLVVTDFVVTDGLSVRLEKQSKSVRNLFSVVTKIESFRQKLPYLNTFVQHHPFMSGFLAQTVVVSGYKRHNFAHAMSQIYPSRAPLPIAWSENAKLKFGLPPRYVTISDGYDHSFHANSNGSAMSTKSLGRFNDLVLQIKRSFPEIPLVQLGRDTGTPMPVDFMLLNKTSLAEMASILQGALFHIDNESGLVHLAKALGVNSAVIFGPTSVDYFGYEDNLNIPPKLCGNCFWVNDKWMRECPRGYREPICMASHNLAEIVEDLRPLLNAARAKHSEVLAPEMKVAIAPLATDCVPKLSITEVVR